MKKLKENERGASAVEFAIVLPLLVLILWGIIEFSILLYDKAMITNLSREAARAAIVFGNRDWTTAELQAWLRGDEDTNPMKAIRNNYRDALISFRPGGSEAPVITVWADDDNRVAGSTLAVNVSYQYHWLYFPNWFGAFKQLDAWTAMRRE